VNGPTTLALTTGGPVAAAFISDTVERAVATEEQALKGTLKCVLAALAFADATLDSVELIAVCTGPGSFTGLRIGVTLAKSIAQGRGLPVVGISSYDVADFGATNEAYPRIAIVEGKRDYYYARVRSGPDASPTFARGTGEDIKRIAEGSSVKSLADVPPAEQALRLAKIGRRWAENGAAADWRSIEIDYGQRPNAVMNWEARRGGERGGAPSAANLSPQ
jgi:tRNA threonylcarbamoyl adenosine modification protein YeaZ